MLMVPQVRVVAAYPGVCDTAITRHMGLDKSITGNLIANPILWFFKRWPAWHLGDCPPGLPRTGARHLCSVPWSLAWSLASCGVIWGLSRWTRGPRTRWGTDRLWTDWTIDCQTQWMLHPMNARHNNCQTQWMPDIITDTLILKPYKTNCWLN